MTNPEPSLKRSRSRLPVPPPPHHPDAAFIVPGDYAALLLDRANAQILQSVGFTGCTRLVQESLRTVAEDYMVSMMRDIQRLSQVQRRTRPTVVDFQQMLIQRNISVNSLDDEMRRVPSTPPPQLPSPPPISPDELEYMEDPASVRDLLGTDLDGATDNRSYIADYLPPFPSKHTYLTTPVFTERPREPRVIREMATQEAILAESALRKILVAEAMGNSKPKPPKEDVEGEKEVPKAAVPSVLKKRKRDEIWERAFNAIKSSEEVETKLVNGGGEHFLGGEGMSKTPGKGKEAIDANVWLEVIVNSDRQYWMGGAGGKTLKGRQA